MDKDGVINSYSIAVLILILCFTLKSKLDYNRLKYQDEIVDISKFKVIVVTNVISIFASFIYAVCYDYFLKYSALNFLIYVFPSTVLFYLIYIQSQHRNGMVSSIEELSGALFFVSLITDSALYLVGYTFLYLWKTHRIREEEENETLKLLRISRISVAISIIETLLAIVLSFVEDEIVVITFKEKFIIYAIIFLLLNFLFPFINRWLSLTIYLKKYEWE